MSNPDQPNLPPRCRRTSAQQMRLRLARARVMELRSTDMAAWEPAGLFIVIERLLNTAEDLIALADEDCSDGE